MRYNTHAARNDDCWYDDGEQGFPRRRRALVVVAALVLFGAGGVVLWKKQHSVDATSGQVPSARVMPVTLQEPTPMPTPLPVVKPEKVQPMIDNRQVIGLPVSIPKQPDVPAPPGTNIKGTTPGGSLSDTDGGVLFGNGGNIGGEGSRWDRYAVAVQTRIAEALRRNSHTRNAKLSIKVRIWPDGTGRIARAQLVDSTGDAATDDAIKNEVLTGLQLEEAPPPDMPKPIVLRLTASHTN